MDQNEGSLSDEVDIAIFYGKGNWDNVQVERLSEENLVILTSPKLLAQKSLTQAEDLREHQLIHIHTRDNWRNMLDYLQLDGINLQHAAVFSHTFMALQAAIHGQGIVLANKILAQQEIEQNNLQIVLPYSLKDPKSFYVVNRLEHTNDDKIQAFRNWIIQSFIQHSL